MSRAASAPRARPRKDEPEESSDDSGEESDEEEEEEDEENEEGDESSEPATRKRKREDDSDPSKASEYPYRGNVRPRSNRGRFEKVPAHWQAVRRKERREEMKARKKERALFKAERAKARAAGGRGGRAAAARGGRRRKGKQSWYVCCTPAAWLMVHRRPSLDAAEIAKLYPGDCVRMLRERQGNESMKQGGRVSWAFVLLPDEQTRGWVPTRQGSNVLMRAGVPRMRVIDYLGSQRTAATRNWLRREGFKEVPEGLIEGQVTEHCVPLIRAMVRCGYPEDKAPLSIVVGCKEPDSNVVTILYACTAKHVRKEGMMRLLVAHFLKECCRSSDEVVVLSVDKDPVWRHLGFVPSAHDPKTTGPHPVTDASATCLEWPAGKDRPDPDPLWKAATAFKRARLGW
eukprot:TRINITY_DN50441_c0_g1_i1.p1 TRINITY_DN50441_c0_g1~~TRINITY_DN50441_c0_g1_i1.p1  ORF type:complete len:401 (+),score=36.87 TRINITY_DN50441_c0_g1_i1:97-1299(+)